MVAPPLEKAGLGGWVLCRGVLLLGCCGAGGRGVGGPLQAGRGGFSGAVAIRDAACPLWSPRAVALQILFSTLSQRTLYSRFESTRRICQWQRMTFDDSILWARGTIFASKSQKPKDQRRRHELPLMGDDIVGSNNRHFVLTPNFQRMNARFLWVACVSQVTFQPTTSLMHL